MRANLCVIAAMWCLSFVASLHAVPRKEFFTEDEIDLIRDAQELKLRVPLYLDLAERL